ncbi:hypothetical protein LOD99_399 [Oopsacas minuta]|uniref:Cilia- and flagella-associated protein 206 n=1 Tax=Oopsacas minuta TaxID=111878 RepID=A0AAV7KBI1_9METZ|nr:hypothetical protein LOD99_399 [Oopsacas minuta]
MSQAQVESMIKNIIREIMSECERLGESRSETLTAFMVKSVVLDPDNQFNVNKPLTRTDVQRLIQTCVTRLTEQDSARLETIQLQVYFDMNYTPRDNFLSEHHRLQHQKLQNLHREIMDTRARTREELDSLYRKIVMFVLLNSGIGSPNDIIALKESTAALQSVFPQSELGPFMSLSRQDKEQQLRELCQIVPGIRLFNRDAKKGGEGIEDLPAMFQQLCLAARQELLESLSAISSISHRLTACAELLNEDNGQHFDRSDYFRIKDCLVNTRQNEAFLLVILTDLATASTNVELAHARFETDIASLREAVHSKSAVPTEIVYPLFMAVWSEWSKFQDELVLLSVLSNVHTNMKQFCRMPADLVTKESIKQLLDSASVYTDEQRRTAEVPIVNTALYPNIDFIFPENLKNFDQVPLEFSGFCAYSLAYYSGLLIPGIPKVALVKYKNKIYSFSSSENAVAFAQSPDQYIDMIIECSRKSPELIQLLYLQSYFSTAKPAVHPGKLVEAPLSKSEQSTQTDTHILQPTIDKSYEWNEWELRRKLIRLTNLRTKITHSTQTDLSNFRRENDTQVYLPKDKWTQSTREKMTTVPKPSTFVTGLRGKGQPHATVNFTIPKESHY